MLCMVLVVFVMCVGRVGRRRRDEMKATSGRDTVHEEQSRAAVGTCQHAGTHQ